MKISLKNLSTKNLATLAHRVINASQTGSYTIVDNHPLLLALENAYTDYDAVYTKLTYSGKGNIVAEADRERDVIFNNIKAFLNGYRQLSSAPNHQMAVDLYNVFRVYGLKIDRMSYSAQTAQMKKLIEDLERLENAQKINALSINVAFDELKNAQTAFETLFAEQAESNAALRQMKSATAIRKDVEIGLRLYFNLVTAMKDTNDEWKALYADLNEYVKAAKNSSLPASSKDQPDDDAQSVKK